MTSNEAPLDLLVINPGGREIIYQDLALDLIAVEPPLWSRLLAGYSLDRGHSVDILDTEAEEMLPTEVASRVVQRHPRLVALVVFGHQPSASTQQMASAGQLSREIKALAPDLPIIIVGGHVSALPERTLREEAVDFTCNSEGPVTVEQLLCRLKDGITPDTRDNLLSQVPGLVWWQGEQVVNNLAPPLIKDLDQDLHGNVWHLLPMAKYRAHNWQCFNDLSTRQPYASIYTSLGCPYKCSFCCINAPFGANRYRMRSPEKVVEEIRHLYTTYGVATFKIIDEMFVLNDRHVTEICTRLAAEPYAKQLNIWAYARIDTVKSGQLPLLRAAGIRWLALGIESGSAHVRDGASKSFDADDIREVVRQIQLADINVIGNYIFGLPDDTLETMRETLNLALELNCEFANLYSAMAYPGSPLYRQAVEQNWQLPESWSGFSQHSYDCTPLPTQTLSSAEVLRFRDQAFHELFESKRYLDMVTQRFGQETAEHIRKMARQRLKRRIVEELEAHETAAE